MVSFDQVLPALVDVLESRADFSMLKACVVVRDLRGRVRVVVDDSSGTPFDTAAAGMQLRQRLGGYFEPPIWSIAGKRPDEVRLARELIKRAEPFGCKYHDIVTGQERDSAPTWRKYERRLSKNEWLDLAKPLPAWKLESGAPCITTFYSFKGGIGRTTALASCAWQLADAGHKVVVLDLDLESPGVGTLLGAQSERGVLDLLIDAVATGAVELNGAYSPAHALDFGDMITVLPAGKLDDGFVEKLSRLDFTSHNAPRSTASSPVEEALRKVLAAVRSELKPAHIFLDARSGIHDLSALSLHRLAHTDVLFARAGEQSYQGLDLTLRSLIRRKGHEDLQCIVVHAMADPGDGASAREELMGFRRRVFGMFNELVYQKDSKRRKSLEAEDAPHTPFVLPFIAELVRFNELKSRGEFLKHSKFQDLCERIRTLATIDDGSDQE